METECALCGEKGHTHDDHWLVQEARARGLAVVTAAQKGRLDALTWTTAQGETFTHCTLAERAVLDAAYALPRSTLLYARNSSPWRHLARAELARRGDKD